MRKKYAYVNVGGHCVSLAKLEKVCGRMGHLLCGSRLVLTELLEQDCLDAEGSGRASTALAAIRQIEFFLDDIYPHNPDA